MSNKVFSFLFLLFSLSLFSCASEQVEQPNILFVLCDDLGYGDLSCYGHPQIQTPVLDELAGTGVRFTNYYSAAPVCSPSRAGLLTGRSPNKAGVYDFIPGIRKAPDCRDLVHLQKHEKTIPSLLKTVGYSTCLSGKWHCSSRFNSDKQPKPSYFGFDHWFATHNNAAPTHHNPNNFVRNGEHVGEIEGYSCQIVVDEAIAWLDTVNADNPFYLQLCFHEPHEPIASPEELVAEYREEAVAEEQALYFANVANVDKAVGRMLDYLKAKGLTNTLVVFTSDNGPETLNRYHKAFRSYGTPGDLKGMKLWTSEAGFRVPCIMAWLDGGAISASPDAVVSALDFLPTFVEMGGAETPEVILDGQSIVPLLKGETFEREKPLIWAFYNALNDVQIAMRHKEWKIMAKLKLNGEYYPLCNNIYDGNIADMKACELADFELYHISEDIGETRNLVEAEPEVFQEMKTLFEQEYKSLLDQSYIWSRK